MRAIRAIATTCVLAIGGTACSSSNGLTGGGAVGVASQGSTSRGWMSRDAKQKQLLYVSEADGNNVDIFSLPGHARVGLITSGLSQPEGIATDAKGNLYVSNLNANTITVYKPGETSPSLTLTEPDGPDDVAVGGNGYVYVADVGGGVDAYSPGATSPTSRLTNSSLGTVSGVAVDALNNVYAAGVAGSHGSHGPAAVVEFADARGSGKNLDLKQLGQPAGVLLDNKNDLVVSDYGGNLIEIYPSGKTSPSSTFPATHPGRSALNEQENHIYVPKTYNNTLVVYDYPEGTRRLTIRLTLGFFASGTALSPPAKP